METIEKPSAIEDLLKYLDEGALKVCLSTLAYHCKESSETRPFNIVMNEIFVALIVHPLVWIGMHTPYGDTPVDSKAHVAEEIIPLAIGRVSTACRGGFKIASEWNIEIPDEYRDPYGWYEEDCDWCIPFHFLKDKILESFKEVDLESPFDDDFWLHVEEMFHEITSKEPSKPEIIN